MLTLVIVLKLWAEIALFALAGRWVLSLLLGARTRGNMVDELLSVVTRPVVRGVARLLPRSTHERQHTAVSAFVLVLLWLGATAGKVWLCLGPSAGQCG